MSSQLNLSLHQAKQNTEPSLSLVEKQRLPPLSLFRIQSSHRPDAEYVSSMSISGQEAGCGHAGKVLLEPGGKHQTTYTWSGGV
jgi:hypothetical protein